MSISPSTLERLGIRLPPETVERLVVEAMEQLLAGRPVAVPLRELSAPEADTLARGGVRLDPLDLAQEDPLLRTATEYGAILATSLTVAGAATRLGVDPSRVRHRLADRTVYGVKVSGGWRLPLFQFAGDRLVPGLERVLPSLAPDLHPVEVWRWLSTPTADLPHGSEEMPLSPLDWLLLGLDPAPVARLAAAV